MTPSAFVRQLAAVAPDRERLATVGATAAEVALLQQSFVCIPRPRLREAPIDVDEAVAFIEGWDASQVEIGMVRFSRRSSAVAVGTQIGSLEGDPLVVTPDHGEVVVVEAGVPAHILWRAAENGGRLLDALFVAARFLAKRMVNEIDIDDLNAARVEADRCAAAAGGARYRPFYSMLLGADSSK
jgi:hypothetical protein